jgi:segregation and condensation protein A
MEDANPTPEPPAPRTGEFRVSLTGFEGPLDLLLHLIKKHELDILDLPVSFITERYLEYLKIMQELDLDMAGEYLVMAATLAHIKSKMLLPQVPGDQQDEGEGEDEQDPRLSLIRRLLEYQKYKEAAESLGSRSVAGRDVFVRGMSAVELQGPAPLAEIGLFKLLDAFGSILERAKDRLSLEVSAERITIQERITQITDMLRDRRSCVFEELFAGDVTRYEIVVTFLALLEMTKLRVTRIYQADHRSPLHVQYALLDADAPTIPPEGMTPEAAVGQVAAQVVITSDAPVADTAAVEFASDELTDDDEDDDYAESDALEASEDDASDGDDPDEDDDEPDENDDGGDDEDDADADDADDDEEDEDEEDDEDDDED